MDNLELKLKWPSDGRPGVPDTYNVIKYPGIIIGQAKIMPDPRIKELEEEVKLLHALQGAGVDNWDGYDIACEMMSDLLDIVCD